MSDYNTNPTNRLGTPTARTSVVVDQGLRAYMLRVYNYMALGLAITGAAALGTFVMAVDRSGGVAKLTAFGCTEASRDVLRSREQFLHVA